MAVLELPVRNDAPAYRFQLVLEDQLYFFEFTFNTRMNRWLMDIQDEAQEDLILGIPVLLDQSLLDGYTISGLPPGVFIALDIAGKNRQPDRDNFGVDCKLFYMESTT